MCRTSGARGFFVAFFPALTDRANFVPRLRRWRVGDVGGCDARVKCAGWNVARESWVGGVKIGAAWSLGGRVAVDCVA